MVLHRAAALAAPSRAEGFGLPVLEAMAAGVPVVTSDAPALVEVAGGAAAGRSRGTTRRRWPGRWSTAGRAERAGRSGSPPAGARAGHYSWSAAARELWRLYSTWGHEGPS